jgi:hypothetical protein
MASALSAAGGVLKIASLPYGTWSVYSNRGAVRKVTVAGRQLRAARLTRKVFVNVCCAASFH